jgi:AcrR family transcriptional regulator
MTDATLSTPPADAKGRIVDALLELAAERDFEDISISDIAARAGVGLADFRDAFPSKGAVLAGFNRRVDRAVLSVKGDALDGEPAKERLFDVLMRRLDAMAPWRDGLRGVARWARRDPLAAAALNRESVNSMRFMLEAAGVDSEGALGALKTQGLALAFARVFDVWLEDDAEGLPETMAALDRELTRGGALVGRAEDLRRLTRPLRGFARSVLGAALERGRRRSGARGSADDAGRGWPRPGDFGPGDLAPGDLADGG